MRSKGVKWQGMLAIGLALVMGLAEVAFAAEKIVIGGMYPMTGRGGRYGIDSVAAAEIAADEINAKGGVNGRMIDLIFTDDKSNTSYAVKVANRYIKEDKVNFLMGVVSSAVGLAVTEVSKENKIIFVGTDHASTALTMEKFQPYYFRVSNNTYQSAAAAAKYATDKKEWKKYYVIGPDYEYGHRTWEDFWMLLGKKRNDVKMVGQAWPKLYEPDYTPYITAILNAKPDVLVTSFWGGDTVAFIKQALPYKLFDKMKMFNYDGGGNYEVLEALPNTLPKGLILSARHHNNWPDTRENKEYVKKFKAKTGRYPSYAASGAYARVYFIAEGVRQAGTAELRRVRALGPGPACPRPLRVAGRGRPGRPEGLRALRQGCQADPGVLQPGRPDPGLHRFDRGGGPWHLRGAREAHGHQCTADVPREARIGEDPS